jgi:hypothetical protein
MIEPWEDQFVYRRSQQRGKPTVAEHHVRRIVEVGARFGEPRISPEP